MVNGTDSVRQKRKGSGGSFHGEKLTESLVDVSGDERGEGESGFSNHNHNKSHHNHQPRVNGTGTRGRGGSQSSASSAEGPLGESYDNLEMERSEYTYEEESETESRSTERPGLEASVASSAFWGGFEMRGEGYGESELGEEPGESEVDEVTGQAEAGRRYLGVQQRGPREDHDSVYDTAGEEE